MAYDARTAQVSRSPILDLFVAWRILESYFMQRSVEAIECGTRRVRGAVITERLLKPKATNV